MCGCVLGGIYVWVLPGTMIQWCTRDATPCKHHTNDDHTPPNTPPPFTPQHDHTISTGPPIRCLYTLQVLRTIPTLVITTTLQRPPTLDALFAFPHPHPHHCCGQQHHPHHHWHHYCSHRYPTAATVSRWCGGRGEGYEGWCEGCEGETLAFLGVENTGDGELQALCVYNGVCCCCE